MRDHEDGGERHQEEQVTFVMGRGEEEGDG